MGGEWGKISFFECGKGEYGSSKGASPLLFTVYSKGGTKGVFSSMIKEQWSEIAGGSKIRLIYFNSPLQALQMLGCRAFLFS